LKHAWRGDHALGRLPAETKDRLKGSRLRSGLAGGRGWWHLGDESQQQD